MQSEINIGLIGHVDHGKTTLTKALSGIWTDTHSEEIKRGISIRLGYAECEFYRCPKCGAPECYCSHQKCPKCGSEAQLLRKVSFVDAPGHETLMATMLSGAAIMDGALLVIAANEPCPQPQTVEHLTALNILGIQNIVVAQNKIDLISKEKAIENQRQILEFLKGYGLEKVSIIPIAAHYNANIDALIKAIEEKIPTPKRDLKKSPRMYVARSFDINKPGSGIAEIKGGIVGGSLMQGRLKVGDEIELRPGTRKKNVYRPLRTTVVSLMSGKTGIEEAKPGGLIGINTTLDPALTKSDSLAGNMLGHPGKLPEVREELTLDIRLFKELLGRENEPVKPLVKGEPLMFSVGSAVTVGLTENPKKGEFKLKLPVCAEDGSKVAISRRIGARWHLIGYGVIK